MNTELPYQIVKDDGTTIVFNGGKPLEGCPKDWEEAEAWEGAANEGKSYDSPKWKFDCGFKLDFDGPIIEVSSRFYPPKEGYGPKWNGDVTIVTLGKDLSEKKFECDTLEQLRSEVESYVSRFSAGLNDLLKGWRESDEH